MIQQDLSILLNAFVQGCRDTFGDHRLEAIIQHGSSIKGGAIPGYSDIDFQIFLSPECFDEGVHLLDDLCFAFQGSFGDLPWEETGYSYPQVYFYDRARLPDWWTGPAPGTYAALLGELPGEAIATAEKLRTGSVRLLREIPRYLASDLGGFVDSIPSTLARRLRLLGTTVSPSIFALVSHDAEDALYIWSLSKFEALDLLAARYPNAPGPALARLFYEEVTALYGGDFEPRRARQAFRTGVTFLRWAESIGRKLVIP